MNTMTLPFRPSLLAALFLVACSTTTASTPNAPAQNPPADDDKTATTRDALEFVAPCVPATCGEVPSSSKSTKPACSDTAGACGWSDDPNGSVSFRQCEPSECGAEPDASVCPSGTTKKGATCGSENEGPCTWRTACAYPPSTTPCPDQNGCGPMPMIGVICNDGTSGELLCMKKGASCDWQRSCE
jgi:hypothetical protein